MIGRIFLRGLVGVAPIALTIALIVWLFEFLERIFAPPIKAIIGAGNYFPGLGVIVAVIIIFAFGILLNLWIVKHLHALFERIFRKIPLVKTLFNSISELMSFFRKDDSKKNNQVVIVTYKQFSFLGLITREEFDGQIAQLGGDEDVAVFIPMSYQIGGFTTICKRSEVKPIDMPVDQALRFSMTAGFGNRN
ncbi:MAG: hypothetical protein S4CHLAM102_15970 [Chlamydiia bacterium]|nr:hypothetical protein [Chlamydiia bacterium]